MPLTQCPECGLEATDRPSAAVVRKAIRRVVMVLALLGAVAYCVLNASSNSGSDGSFPPRFPSAASSIEDVRAIAGNEAPPIAPGTLAQAVIDAGREPYSGAPANAKVFVALGAAPHVLTRTTTWGFPFTSVRRVTHSVYDDALSQTGFQPSTTDPSMRPLTPFEEPTQLPAAPARPVLAWWSHGAAAVLAYQPAPERTRGVFETWQFHMTPIALLAATTVFVAAIIYAAWKWASRRPPQSRARRKLISLALSAAIILGATLALRDAKETTGYPSWLKMRALTKFPQPVFYSFDDFVELPLSRNDILSLKDRPDGDAVLARAILHTVAQERQSGHFAVWTVFEGTLKPASGEKNMWDIPIAGLHRSTFHRHPLFGNTDQIAATPGWAFRARLHSITIGKSIDGDMWSLRLPIPQLIAFIVCIFTAYWGCILLVRLLLNWRARRRFRRAQCIKCGYSLA